MASLPFPPGFHATKFIDIPPKFFIGHLIGGKITKDIQKLTGAEILFLKGNQGRKPRKLEIRGSLDDVKLAEEFLRAFFKHKNPSRGSDGLNPGVLKVWFVVGSRSLLARPFEQNNFKL